MAEELPIPDNADDNVSLKPKEFCKLEKISLPIFRRLLSQGLGPKYYNVPGTTIKRITPEARREWRERMEQLTAERAAELEQERKQRSDKAALLGKLAVASPKHPQAKSMRKRRKAGAR